jgi:hypothetical protein
MAHMDVRALWDGTLVATAADQISEFTSGTPWVNENALARQSGMRIATIPMDVCDSATTAIPTNPDVGWWGFLEPNQVGFPTVESIFRQVGNRIVLVCDMHEAGTPRPQGPLLLEMIQRYGLTKSVIVMSVNITRLAPFVAAGVATGLVVPDDAWAAAHPPQALVDAGVTWAQTMWGVSNGEIIDYAQAGISVLISTVNRHSQRARVENVGARGVISDDPLYYSADPARYQRPDRLLQYTSKTAEIGHLTASTDQGRLNTAGTFLRDARGYFTAGRDGLSMPAGVSASVYPNGCMSILAGNLCPISDPSYRIRFQVRFDTAPAATGRWLGLAACWMSDAPVRDDPAPTEQGYLCVQEWSGTLRIYKKNAGPGVQTGTAFDWGTPTVGTWYDLTLRVSPTELRLYRTADENTPANHAVSTDTQFRGGYVSLVKAELTTTFEGSFQNVQVIPG